jgi:hypothetical protein
MGMAPEAHVRHWADGGASDVDNAALLCQRHRTLVHRRRLLARVREARDEHGRYVVWDLADGSDDRHLEALERERAVHDPPPLTPERLRSLLEAIRDTDPRRANGGPGTSWTPHNPTTSGWTSQPSTRSGPTSAAPPTTPRPDPPSTGRRHGPAFAQGAVTTCKLLLRGASARCPCTRPVPPSPHSTPSTPSSRHAHGARHHVALGRLAGAHPDLHDGHVEMGRVTRA